MYKRETTVCPKCRPLLKARPSSSLHCNEPSPGSLLFYGLIDVQQTSLAIPGWRSHELKWLGHSYSTRSMHASKSGWGSSSYVRANWLSIDAVVSNKDASYADTRGRMLWFRCKLLTRHFCKPPCPQVPGLLFMVNRVSKAHSTYTHHQNTIRPTNYSSPPAGSSYAPSPSPDSQAHPQYSQQPYADRTSSL